MDTLRTPDNRFANLPGYAFEPNYLDDLAGLDNCRIHYLDEGPSDADVTWLCLHGQPTWAFLYRKMIPVLVDAGYRAIAMDHLGMGFSDKPIDIADYSYLGHIDRLLLSQDIYLKMMLQKNRKT